MVTANNAIDAFGDCIFALDPETGRVSWASKAFETQFPAAGPGASLDSLNDNLASGLTHLAERAGREDGCYGCLSDDGAVYDAWAGLAVDGLIYVRLQDALARQKAQTRHIADRERLILTSRSMSVGEMASTIAHELNQPLGALSNLLNGLKARASRGKLSGGEAEAALGRALDQVGYASGIIARIREYVDARKPRRETLDLPQIAVTVLDLLDWEIQREGVSAEIAIAPGLPPVHGDAVMIQQVITNLARNAIDAMRIQPCDARWLEIAAQTASDGRVEILISDSGAGLDPERAETLFTPFFTTKPSGMGIGLNICRSIIEIHSGNLWFTRNEAGGTTFHIALPAASESEEAA